ncbi:MAG: SCO family protein [Devosia sp.]|uniref:SCO family protein n=1 Tax=Devosia sp. 66-22 TaxID=1895753 RepID=UPI00092BFFEF|nr:SCO family protein [Devosia sp. 66-22]MBN9348354.1 SCO family protein [Devosia sp.]OJX46342.1 MAG: SCO family protein [Devosia sp. 66-22]
MRTFRIVLWTLVVVAAIGATVLFFTRPQVVNGPGGGQFALVDQRGNPADNSVFLGKPSLLFFGYTHCPDVCPTTMGEMQGWFAALGDEAKTLQGVFVTVDPARDTPEILGDYVSFVSDRIVGLTGSEAEIDKVVRDWGALAEKVPQDDGGYLMNHTASVFLVNSKGEFAGTIAYGENTSTALDKIRRLVANS